MSDYHAYSARQWHIPRSLSTVKMRLFSKMLKYSKRCDAMSKNTEAQTPSMYVYAKVLLGIADSVVNGLRDIGDVLFAHCPKYQPW